MFTPEEKTKDAETAIIVGVITPQESRFEVRDHLNELEHLAYTAYPSTEEALDDLAAGEIDLTIVDGNTLQTALEYRDGIVFTYCSKRASLISSLLIKSLFSCSAPVLSTI